MIKMTRPQKRFVRFNYIFLTFLSISMLVPFFHIIAGSFSSGSAIVKGLVSVWPVEFTLDNYKAVFLDPSIWKSFGVTVYITIFGTFLNLLFTVLMAYPLSKAGLKGRKILILFVLFTLIFQAPMIPSYLVVKSLGMLNTLWALMIPGLISSFNLIIMMSFFQNIPKEMFDCAKIDGCGEYRALWSIVLPLSLPSLSTIGLFYAVAHWNGYFQAIMFIRDQSLFPLQVKLRQLIVESDAEQMIHAAQLTVQSVDGIKMASIIFATLPILVVYPFIQKHFVKGAMLGSIKG